MVQILISWLLFQTVMFWEIQLHFSQKQVTKRCRFKDLNLTANSGASGEVSLLKEQQQVVCGET